MYTVAQIKEWLTEVKDPEIPVISVVDLGIISEVEIGADNSVHITMTPTFAGCPAIDMMQQNIKSVLKRKGVESLEVSISYQTPWTTNKISSEGKQKLKDFGLAPPPTIKDEVDLSYFAHVQCPVCNSKDTILRSTFGPTACRAIFYCNHCKETFEQMKPL